jgi:WD40 repeat protein
MSLEFEHLIGLNAVPAGVIFHPNGQKYIYPSGASVVIADFVDTHSQIFFRQHDDLVTCLCLSPSGNLVASGQRGSNSNVFVWDFNTQEVVYCLEEHDFAVQNVSFSLDEKLLVTIGNPENDGKLIAWDLSTGYICAPSGKLPRDTRCIAHGGFLKDIKRRDTQNYIFCTGGTDGFAFWVLDPYQGEFECNRVSGDGRSSVLRIVTHLVWSDDKEYVFGATTSGDYLIVNVKNQRVMQAVSATRTGLDSILWYEGGIIIGCGDNTIKYFSHANQLVGSTDLDGRVTAMSFSPDKLEVCYCSIWMFGKLQT